MLISVFVSFQMNRPIQVKPADSENRGGKSQPIAIARFSISIVPSEDASSPPGHSSLRKTIYIVSTICHLPPITLSAAASRTSQQTIVPHPPVFCHLVIPDSHALLYRGGASRSQATGIGMTQGEDSNRHIIEVEGNGLIKIETSFVGCL